MSKNFWVKDFRVFWVQGRSECTPHAYTHTHTHTQDPVTSVSFSRDGHCVLASSLDGVVRLFDKDNGELLNEYVSVHVCVHNGP